MTPTSMEQRALSTTMVVRGTSIALVALAALVWPEETLITALTAVALVATLGALYELPLSLRLRRHDPLWWLVLAHAVLMLAFGVLTFVAPRTVMSAPALTIAVVDFWLFAIAGLAAAVITYMEPTPLARRVLWACAASNMGLALFAATSSDVTVFSLLYVGAFYAAIFGIFELLAGLWVRHRLSHDGSGGRISRTTGEVVFRRTQ